MTGLIQTVRFDVLVLNLERLESWGELPFRVFSSTFATHIR